MSEETIFPAYDLDRGYPEGYRSDDAAYFEESRFVHVPPISRVHLKRVSLIRTTLIRGLEIVDEYCRSRAAPRLTLRQTARVYRERFTLPTRRLPVAKWCLDHWSHGYFHWLLDALPRIVATSGCMIEAPLLIPERYLAKRYIAESLDLWRLEYLTYRDERVEIEDLLTTTYPRSCDFNAPSVQRVGQRFRELDGMSSKRGCSRIYVSRKKAARRRILNEPEVEEALRRRGFECVVLEDLSFADQRAMMYEASCLVSNHGAGLANMVFMAPGSRILELKSDARNINNCFFHLAQALGHRYWYSIEAGDSPDVQKANVSVDLENLGSRLDSVLAA